MVFWIKRKIYIIFWLMFTLLLGCDGNTPITPTEISEQVRPSTSTPQLSPTASQTVPPTNSPTASTTPTIVPSSTPTLTPSATPSPTSTPHPLDTFSGQIVFDGFINADSAEIFLMKPDGSDLRQLTEDNFINFGPKIAPNGQKIAFNSIQDGMVQIYLMDIDGSNISRLTMGEGNARDPNWSPDGSKIAFSSDRDGDPEIFIINSDGSGERQLTNNDTSDVTPIWSPNGEWIAFSSAFEAEDPNIFLMRPDGSELTRITFSPSYDGDALSWSPDGEWLIFPAQRIGNYELYALRLEDRLFGPLTRTEGDEYSGLLSSDGRYLLINVFYEDYTGLIVQDLAKGITIELTSADIFASNGAWNPIFDAEYDPTFLEQAILPDETCTYATDESYGYTAENPIPIGNGPIFGGPFDGFNLYTYVRGTINEPQEWVRGHTFPSNSQEDVLDTLYITTESGQEITLFVRLFDYSVPEIPVGMYCDLEYP